jgi:prepilin-type N-terminal cleavage/methylation domain-containing protein
MDGHKRGFTLVELLVAIAIMAILIAVMIPSIAGIWSKSRNLVDLSNLRATHSDFVAWSVDRNGAIPNAGSPYETSAASRGYYGVFHNDDRGWGLYTLQNELWPNLLRQNYNGQVQDYWHSSYADFSAEELDSIPTTLVSPGDGPDPAVPNATAPEGAEPEPGIIGDVSVDLLVENAMDYRTGSIAHLQTEYRLGLTLLTDANIWSNPGAIRSTQWVRNSARRVRFSDAANPARKGLLYHNDWPRADEGWHHVAFIDGSVALKNWADAQPTAVSPFDTSGEPGVPVNATYNGYRGVDF